MDLERKTNNEVAMLRRAADRAENRTIRLKIPLPSPRRHRRRPAELTTRYHMKIFAKAGNRYLLVRDGVSELGPETEARILDMNEESLFWWENVHSTLAHTAQEEWVEYTDSQDVLDDLLEQVEEVPKPE